MVYIVTEVQNASATSYSYTDRGEAESKFHLILSYAAVSDVQRHGAYLYDNEGNVLNLKFYIREAPQQ